MPPLDGFVSPRTDIQVETDAVVRAFGLRVSRLSLSDMAAEMERRVHVFSGGPVAAMQIVAELRRRALFSLRPREAGEGDHPKGGA